MRSCLSVLHKTHIVGDDWIHLDENLCCGCPLEVPCQGEYIEHRQPRFYGEMSKLSQYAPHVLRFTRKPGAGCSKHC